MKKSLIIFVFTGLAVALFYACKKNTDLMQTNNNTEQQYTDYELEVFYKLQSFKQKLNSNLKGTDPMTLDSAKWYMETNFNVDKARTEEPYRITRNDSTYYVLPLNNDGLVEFNDMNIMYNQMLSDLDSLEIVIADPNILAVFARLELLTTNASEAEFMLVTGFGNYYNSIYWPFFDDDDWYFGNMLGRCDGTYIYESDGGQELKTRLNNPYIQWVGPGSFVDPVQRHAFYYEYPDVNNENPEPKVDYMIYYEESPNGLQCLENEELTFYLNMAHNIFYTYDTQFLLNTTLHGKRPFGKAFMNMTICTPSGDDWWEHKYYMFYGTRINLPLPD